jgi:hypothetical protein
MAEDVGFVLQYIYHPTHRERDEVIYKKFPTGWRGSLREQVTLRVYEEEFWGPAETLGEMMDYIRGVYEHLKTRTIIGDFRMTVA